ncbi:hypothetical protein, partial [Bradyrhizobium sp. CW7]|uniref:hypothetical protein n=1 Tax=Bradyrhizobium sp. CW7 TaxID=2782688 RepID=UPI001FF906AA
IIVCHHKVSTYFGGHLMHQSTQKQKVQGNSRLRSTAGHVDLGGLHSPHQQSSSVPLRAFVLQSALE